MQRLIHKYKDFYGHDFFWASTLGGFLLLFLSLIINFYTGGYVSERASNAVTDIILSNTPVYAVGSIFIYGAAVFMIIVAILCLVEPKRIPFVLKSAALFVFVRAIFISVTHIGPFPNQTIIDPTSFINKITSGSDLFFSGHTGFPFLMALIFWKDKYLRYFFVSTSLFFGIVVLLGHMHYTIDVLSAFFITYGIFHMAEFLFKKEWLLLLRES